jgi:hypothetical protein
MKQLLSTLFLTATLALCLGACSSQNIAPTANKAQMLTFPKSSGNKVEMYGQEPPLTIIKDDRTLSRVRVLDGGVCKNTLEGVKGTFLIYADLNDIERVKREQGIKVFAAFEKKIIDFTAQTMQKVINDSNLGKNPFALDADDARQKLVNQFNQDFDSQIALPVNNFQNETSLTLVVKAIPANLIFYQQGCSTADIQNKAAR